jgi:hypothetical protein
MSADSGRESALITGSREIPQQFKIRAPISHLTCTLPRRSKNRKKLIRNDGQSL